MTTFDSSALSTLTEIIRSRRSIYPQQFSGETIPQEKVALLLENAHYAPNHGRTEPWYFIVYSGEGRERFGKLHAEVYKQQTNAEAFKEDTYTRLMNRPLESSHFIVVCMRRGSKPNIPVWEEQAAVACAVQNLHLTATALGLGGYWGTGGMVMNPALSAALGLGEQDVVMGFFQLGIPKADFQVPPSLRSENWEAKVRWEE